MLGVITDGVVSAGGGGAFTGRVTLPLSAKSIAEVAAFTLNV